MSDIQKTKVYTPNTTYLQEKARKLWDEIKLLEDFPSGIPLDSLESAFNYMRQQTYAINQELNKLSTVAKQEVLNKARQPEAPYLGEEE